jgi:hypothetical protein
MRASWQIASLKDSAICATRFPIVRIPFWRAIPDGTATAAVAV